MSTTIDDRVVEMRFDNRHFEENVQDSISALEKLKQSLNLTGASKGLDELQSTAGRFNLSGLTGAAEAVGVKFSHMQATVQYQLNRIVTSAIDTGRRITSALTIDPMKMGFQEYETQINAVQTILANTESKGTTLKDVNSALDTLNKYADKTIYNFTEMTRNIGTFTAAGVDLDTSVNAIQGIANLAAVSGSSSQQASTAMYQLSQALSSGTVKLMDWNSVVNAGMGGQVFQDALKETARVHGIAIDDMIKKDGSFRETLSSGWLTSEILTETLEKFTMSTEGLTEAEIEANRERLRSKGYTEEQIEAIFKLGNTATNAATKVKTFTQLMDTTKEALQSGWTQSWEYIIGDFEEAKEFYTEISNTLGEMINASAEERNALLKGWHDGGGRTHLIDSIRNSFEALMSVITPIKEAFREIFPPITVKQLLSFTEGLKNLTSNLKLSTEVSDNIKRTFKGLFAIVDIGVHILSALFNAAKLLIKPLAWIASGLLEVTAYLGDWFVKLDEAIKKTDFFNAALEGIIKFVKMFADAVSEKFGFDGFEVFHAFLERVQDRASGVGGVISALGETIGDVLKTFGESLSKSNFMTVMETLWKGIQTLATGIGKALGSLVDGFADIVSNSDFSGLTDLFNAVSLGSIAAFVMKFVNSFSDAVDVIDDFRENAIGILTDVRGCFEAYQSSLKAGTLLTIASAIAILTGSLVVLSLIDSNKLLGSIAAISSLMAVLMGSFKIFTMINDNAGEMAKACGAMISMSVAVLILSAALKQIGDLGFGQMITGVVGVAGLALVMVGVAEILGHSKKTVISGAVQMVVFASAIKILASACADMGSLDWDELAKGLIGVSTLMGAVALFLSFTKFDSGATSSAIAIVLLAGAMKIMASACEDFGKLDWDELAKGLLAIGAVLTEIVLFTRTVGNSPQILTTAASLVIIGGAIQVFAYACKSFGSLNWEVLGRGLLGMAGALTIVGLAVRLMPMNMISIGLGLVAVSASLLVMAEALKRMGNMTWEEIGKGLVVLASSMTIFAIALRSMTGTLTGSSALLVATAAILVLVPALSMLGAMEWSSIVKGLVTIAAAFTILGIAGYALASVVPAIIGLASSITLVGAGILSAGLGMLYFGAGLAAIAAGLIALSGSATAVVAAIEIIILGLIDMIPAIEKSVGDIIVAFFDAIAASAESIGNAFNVIVLTIIDVLVTCVPAIAEGFLQMILGVIDVLVQYSPQITDKLADWLIETFNALEERIPEIVQAGVDLMMAFFEGMNQAVQNMDGGSLNEALRSAALLGQLFAIFAGMSFMIPSAMAGILGAAAAIKALDVIFNDLGFIDNMSDLEWLGGKGATMLENIGTAIGSFYGGVASSFTSSMSDVLPKIGEDLSKFMKNITPFINGVKKVDGSVYVGSGILAATVAGFALSEVYSSIADVLSGNRSLSDIGKELSEFMKNVQPYVEGAKSITPEIITATSSLVSVITMLTSAALLEGITSWITGGSSIDTFGSQLPDFGTNIKDFADNLGSFGKPQQETIATAMAAISEIANVSKTLPNQGGWLAGLVGDNKLSTFGAQLPDLGTHLKDFATNLGNFGEEQKQTVVTAVTAIKELSSAAEGIPNQGGWLAKIVGDNRLSSFGAQLPVLGQHLCDFANKLGPFGEPQKNAVICASTAIKEMAIVAEGIPNQGGWIAAIVGDNTVSGFAAQLPSVGSNLAAFATNLGTFGEPQKQTVICAATAIKEMSLASVGLDGQAEWAKALFGDNSLAAFAEQMPAVGTNLATFATNLGTFGEEQQSTIVSAATAIKEMSLAASGIDGQSEWAKKLFGDNSLATFATQMPEVGTKLAEFATNLGAFGEEQKTTIVCAASAIKDMSVAAAKIDGQSEWAKALFGDNSLATFAAQMPTVGTNLSLFATNLGTFGEEQRATVECAASAIKDMSIAASGIDGQSDWAKKLFGDNSLATFSDQMPTVGSNIASFAENLGTFGPEQQATVESGISAIESFAKLADADLKGANKNLDDFGENMVDIAKDVTDFCDEMPESSAISSTVDNFRSIINVFKSITSKESETAKTFTTALHNLGKEGINKFVEEFSGSTTTTKADDAAKKLLMAVVEGMKSKEPDMEKTITTLVNTCISALSSAYDTFKGAGSYMVDGFVAGISANTYKAAAQAEAMAKAAKEAAEAELGIASPSKEFYRIGDYSGQGFVNALHDFASVAYKAGSSMAGQAKEGLSNAMNNISDIIAYGIEAEPTISPVVDLSNVKAGARSINDMFGDVIALRASMAADSISYSMNRRVQNGANDDVVSAINKLGNKIGTGGDTFNFGDFTYSGNTEISDAVQTLVRAARIERRK